jgi:hypothetical protein
MSILTLGSSPGRGMRLNLPIAIVPLRRTDNWTLDFPATGRIFGRRADVAHPRPGSFGAHGHQIDFCERAAFYQLCHKSNLRFADSNWITNFAIKAIYALRTATGSSCCPQSVNCFYGKVGKTLRSHTYRPPPNHGVCASTRL